MDQTNQMPFPYRSETTEPLRKLKAINLYFSTISLGKVVKETSSTELTFELTGGLEKLEQLRDFVKEGILNFNQNISSLYLEMTEAIEQLTKPYTSRSIPIEKELQKTKVTCQWLEQQRSQSNDLDWNQNILLELIRNLPNNAVCDKIISTYYPYVDIEITLLASLFIQEEEEEKFFLEFPKKESKK